MEKVKTLFKNSDKRVKFILIIGLLGIVFIFMSQFFVSDTKAETDKTPKEISLEDYKENLEFSLQKFISKIDGVGKSEVFITLIGSGETSFLKENKNDINKSDTSSSQSVSESYVLTDGKDGKTTVVKSRTNPEIKGVLVICDGGDSIKIKAEVLDAVTTAFNLSSSRVYISKLRKE